MRRLLAAILTMAAAPALAQGGGAGDTARAAHGKTEVTWYGQAAFVIKTPRGTVLAVDRWFSNPVAKANHLEAPTKVDFILVTHGHADHVGDAIALGKATGAKLVAPYELAKVLVAAGYPMDPAKLAPTAGNMGGTMVLDDDVSITMVPAVHSSGFQKDPQSVPEYGGNPVGYFIHVKGGPRFYHTGDTAPFSEIQRYARRWPIDVMMACIGGHFTMDPVGAAEQVGWVRPRVVIPMHFGTYPLLAGRPAELEAALRKSGSKARMVEMKPGETRTF